MIAPNVIDITGPIKGETNIAATIFGALFSTNPRAAKELFQQILCIIETLLLYNIYKHSVYENARIGIRMRASIYNNICFVIVY